MSNLRTRSMYTVICSGQSGDFRGDFVGQTFHRMANAMKAAKSLTAVGWTVTIVQS